MIRFIDCIVDQHDDIGDIIIREADFQAGFHFLDRCQRNTVQAGKTVLDILTEIVPFGYGEGLLRLLFLDKETHIMDKSLTCLLYTSDQCSHTAVRFLRLRQLLL